MADWDASRYHRISDPQFDWGQRVLDRLSPRAGDRILDLGCGTGRLTQEIRRGVADGELWVAGLDRSGAMLSVARAAAREAGLAIDYVQGDGTALPFRSAFTAVFSTATLHWIDDHDAVFRSVAGALLPGGRFVAQCGGQGNLAGMLRHTATLMALPEYRPYFGGWREPWRFADAPETAQRLRQAGLDDERAWLEEAPVQFETADHYAEFVSCVCIRHHLHRLPPPLRTRFTGDLTARAADDPRPFSLDYCRLNIDARKVRE